MSEVTQAIRNHHRELADTLKAQVNALEEDRAGADRFAPDSPFYAVVLKGKGMFAGGDEKEKLFGPYSLLIFDPGENHSIRALDDDLVFAGFLHGAPSNISEKVGGMIGRPRK